MSWLKGLRICRWFIQQSIYSKCGTVCLEMIEKVFIHMYLQKERKRQTRTLYRVQFNIYMAKSIYYKTLYLLKRCLCHISISRYVLNIVQEPYPYILGAL